MMKLCKCGCGSEIPIHNTWIKGHHGRGKKRTPQEIENIKKGIPSSRKKKQSYKMKKKWAEGDFDFMNGKTNPSCDPKVGAKIAEANRNRIVKESTKRKIAKSRLGKPGPKVSEKTKKLHSDRMKKYNPMFKKEVLDNHPLFKKGVNFHSEGEKKLGDILTEININFTAQKKIEKEIGYYILDFFIPKYNKIIEFDGHSSHITEKEKDVQRDSYLLNRYQFQTLRILPPELNNTRKESTIEKIKEFIYG